MLSSCFPFKYIRLFLGFIIQTPKTPALKQQSCREHFGLALLPVKGKPHNLCSDVEEELPDTQWLVDKEQWQGWIVSSKKIFQNYWFCFFLAPSGSSCSSEDFLLPCWASSCTPQRNARQGQALFRAPRHQQRSKQHFVVVSSHSSRRGSCCTCPAWGPGGLSRWGRTGAGGVRRLPCHLLLERNHQPPALPSLLSKHTLGEISAEHSPVLHIQTHHPATPNKGAFTDWLSHKGGFSGTRVTANRPWSE